jgi:hypothetical protein
MSNEENLEIRQCEVSDVVILMEAPGGRSSLAGCISPTSFLVRLNTEARRLVRHQRGRGPTGQAGGTMIHYRRNTRHQDLQEIGNGSEQKKINGTTSDLEDLSHDAELQLSEDSKLSLVCGFVLVTMLLWRFLASAGQFWMPS